MGTINITSTGANGTFTHSVAYTIPGADAAGSADPKYARLYISARGFLVARLPPTTSNAGATGTATWSGSVKTASFAVCNECKFVEGIYEVLVEYVSPLDGYKSYRKVDSGSVIVSGPTGCKDCEDVPPDEGGGGGEEEGGGGASEYGEPDAGDSFPPRPRAPGDPCLPPSFTAPTPSVPTPCSGGSGGGSSTPGFN